MKSTQGAGLIGDETFYFRSIILLPLFLANIFFYYPEYAEKLTPIHFCLEFAGSEKYQPYFKILTYAKVKLLPWKHTA